MNWVLVRVGPPLVALRGVAGNRALRRAVLAFLMFTAAEVAAWIAILVFAYDRGGAAATGLVGLLLLLPAGVIAPITAALGDRARRERVLGFGYLAQAIATGATAIAIVLEAPDAVVYAGAVVAMATMTTSRPSHHSLMPTLARTPDELTAANSVTSLAEGIGSTLGTVAVTLVLAIGTAALAYGTSAVLLALAAIAVLTLGAHTEPLSIGRPHAWSFITEAGHGFVAIGASPGPRLLVALAALMTVAWGAFDVLLVSVAIDMLDLGDAGVGVLQIAVGVGALAGAVGSFALVGRRGLWLAMVGATVLLAAGIAGSGAAETVALVIAASLAAGAALTVLDVVGRTLLQRVVDDAVLTRVFGVIEALWMAGVGVGAGLAALLIRAFSVSTALIAMGVALVVLTLPAIPALRRLDRGVVVPGRQLQLLSAIAMFAPLPRTDLERVARQLDRLAVVAGADIVLQGETGDRFYVIDGGAFEVVVDGAVVGELHEGGFFGEIALLHDVPRTATVRAVTDGALWALDQEEFLATVTGQPQAATAAHEISAERLRSAG